jgi:hypothetical protein
MKNNTYIIRIKELSDSIDDRYEFHKKASGLLIQMAKDSNFWNEVFTQNLTDKGYLSRKWTMYEIPFFYVYENSDFYVKVHLFVPFQNYVPHVAASAIHHHNNYLLSTYAAYGSGYETILFEKDFRLNPTTKEANLKVRDHFTQQQRPIHTVDAWEPHVVVNPISLSATLVLWSPNKKRPSDSLRNIPFLKTIKTPLRKLIYAFGLDKKFGIAAKETYQYFVKDNKFYGILEDDFFAPTRAQAGEEVNDYSIQTVFSFMQRIKFDDIIFLKTLKCNPDVPKYYHKWIDKLINGDLIQDTFAKEQINVPGGRMLVDDIIKAHKSVNNL